MSRSEELWEEIEQQIKSESLIDDDQLGRIGKKALSGTISIDDWNLAIESTLLKDGSENGE